MANEPQKWAGLLGSGADVNTIPEETPAGTGAASMKSIFPPITQVPLNAGGIAPDRADFNGLFKLLGDNIYYQQQGGVYSYSAAIDYAKGSLVKHNDSLYIAVQENGPATIEKEPGEEPDFWQEVVLSNTGIIAADTTAARSLENRFADVVNVKDFGAVGDGVTDDTSAIQNAIQSANGASVYFPKGIYITNSNISALHTAILCGDGVLKAGTSEYYTNNPYTHTNTIYISPNGTGDGLSVDRPAEFYSVVGFLQKNSPLLGTTRLKFAQGTYRLNTIASDITTLKHLGLIFEGEQASKAENDWTTIFESPDSGSYVHAFFIQNISSARFKYIYFKSNLNITNGCGLAVGYGCDTIYVETCKTSNTTWSGIIFQKTRYAVVSDCIIASNITGGNLGINVYQTMLATNSSGNTRNTISGHSIGIAAQGTSYVHDDYNDFISCRTAIQSTLGGYIGSNSNTYVDCSYIQAIEQGGSGGTHEDRSGEAFGNRYWLESKFDDNNSATFRQDKYVAGVYYIMPNRKGRRSYGEESLTSVFSSYTYNLGGIGSDAPNAIKSNLCYGNDVTYYKLDGNMTFSFGTQSDANYVTQFVFTETDTSGYRSRIVVDKNGYFTVNIKSNDTSTMFRSDGLIPLPDSTLNLGSGGYKWNNVYAANGTISTSDERLKTEITDPNDALMKAWGKVNFKVFKFKDAIEKKGDNARKHIGVIAQEVQKAFESEGLNASDYGLFCYDEWEDQYDKDEAGNEVLVQKAGNAYAIRYTEALALECAYQRWLGAKREARIKALEAKLK